MCNMKIKIGQSNLVLFQYEYDNKDIAQPISNFPPTTAENDKNNNSRKTV